MPSRPSDLIRGAIAGTATAAGSWFYIENAGGLYRISRAQLAEALRLQGAVVADPANANKAVSLGPLVVWNTTPELMLSRSDNGRGWTMFNWSGAGDQFALAYLTGGVWAANVLVADRNGFVEMPNGLGIGGPRGDAMMRSIVPDEALGILVSGSTKGLRIVPKPGATSIEGVDTSGVGSFQPLLLGGSIVQVAAHFTPNLDNTWNSGGPGNRWATIFAGTASINTSGRVGKRTIVTLRSTSLSDEDPQKVLAAKRLRVGARLARRITSWQFADSIAEKGQVAYDALPPEQQAATTPEAEGLKVARYHIGFVFDEVVADFAAEGLDPYREAAVCRDPKIVKTVVEEPGEVQEVVEEAYDDYESVEDEANPGRALRRKVTRSRPVPQWIDIPLFDEETGAPIMTPSTAPSSLFDGNGQPVPTMVQATHKVPKKVPGIVRREIEEWDGVSYVEALRENHLYALAIAAIAAGVTVED